MSGAVGFRPGQRVRFSSLALPTGGSAGTVAAAPTGGPSLRTDRRVLVKWDHHRGDEPVWSEQSYLVDEELFLAFTGRPLGELPWLGYGGEVQRWKLTAPLRRLTRRGQQA
jgi:hypothetical protein